MKKKRLLITFLLFFTFLFSVNVSAATRTVKLKKNKTVTVYASKKDTFKLKAIKKLKWTSSKKSIATVKASKAYGKVTPKKVGTTIIKGVKGKTKYKCRFIVENPILSASSFALNIGGTCNLRVYGTKQKITWKSSNNNICTVSDTGLVTARGTGTATITASVGKYLKLNSVITISADSSNNSNGTTNNPSGNTGNPSGNVTYNDRWHVKHVEFDHYEDPDDHDIEYYGIITVRNDGNTNLYLDDCTFDIEDSNGHLLATETMMSTCPNVIRPNEDGYFYTSFGGTIKDVSSDTTLVLKTNPKLVRAKKSPRRYGISDTSWKKNALNSYDLIGRVTNTTSTTLSYLYVQAIFFDSEGNAIGVHGTSVTDIEPNVPKSFEMSILFANRKVRERQFKSCKVLAEETYIQY